MELVRSNRTEVLADALASAVRAEPLSPFARETIVVQSLGMERWLTLALSERLGIWSHPWFPFPRAIIERALEDLGVGPSEAAKRYELGYLKWTIAQLLVESTPAELQSYLGNSHDGDRVLRFAASVARVFDRYVVYRPDLLKSWLENEDGDWQAVLWRQTVERIGPHDLSVRIERALSSIEDAPTAKQLSFGRLHLFSLETMPPLFLRFFSELSKLVPTTLYLLEPTSEYSGEVDRVRLSVPTGDATPDGHPFLASVGRLSRDFQQLLLDFDHSVRCRHDRFEAPSRTDLLGSLQADILELRPPPRRANRANIQPLDESISIHACTGPMREVQVLHDLVRGALEADPQLEPEDIIVMTPDLETYAPVFRAVFGQDEPNGVPYEVHDRKTRKDASFYDDFLAVLEVLDSRFSVLDLVRLMDARSMREDFRFVPEERARLTDLLEAAGVRWGIDAEHRAQLEFPAEPLHTWRAGLGRLFLGFASMPQAVEPFEGLLPRGAPSLGDAELVARLSRLCEVLFDAQARTRQPLDVAAWVTEIEWLISRLFAEDDEAGPAAQQLREALQHLQELAESGGYAGAISLKAVRRELAKLLLERTPAAGFLRKGITLTELIPLRSVPFKVVCLLGMSEDAFPRSDDRPSFDRTRKSHRPGDRNKRHDDRHSFLQALLCARDRVIATYSAPSTTLRPQTNPSPVLWELRETVNRYYQGTSGEPLLEPTVHPLHAFDQRYFVGDELPRSFSRRDLQIARTVTGPSSERPAIDLRVEAQSAESVATSLSVNELTSWLWNPMRAFIDRVLQARFDASALYEPSGALTKLGPLEAAKVGNKALRAGLRGRALGDYLEAAPEFPDGSWGRLQRERLAHEINAVHAARQRLEDGQTLRSARLVADVGGVRLEGRLEGLGTHRRVVPRFTRTERKAELAAWVEHLLMHAATESGPPRETHLVLRGTETRASLVSFRPVDEPVPLLEVLIDLHRTCRASPLPLLERSSLVFAQELGKRGRAGALKAARKTLRDRRAWDPRLSYVLGPDDPFEDSSWVDAFEAAAVTLYQPLLDHRSGP